MKLMRMLFGRHPGLAVAISLLSISSAAIGVGVIAFINLRLAQPGTALGPALVQFAGLLLALLASGVIAQIGMTSLGHRGVLILRNTLLKRILDTSLARLGTLGPSRIQASLSADVQMLSVAFVRLPVVIHGALLSVAASAYLAWLSLPLFLATLALIGSALLVAWRLLGITHREVASAREAADQLYDSYRAVLEGRKELRLNRHRAQKVYEEEFERSACADRRHQARADLFYSAYSNWISVMLLAAIGLSFFLANHFGWADNAVATTFAVTLLYLSAPLGLVVGAMPGIISGNVALAKLDSLELAPYQEGFALPQALPADWQSLTLEDVHYRYGERDGEAGFAVGPLNLTLQRGEVVFLIGGNGSGKSSMARLLCGLSVPDSGRILFDGQPLDAAQMPAYRQLFAAVFSDFHLFAQLLDGAGATADSTLVAQWLERLALGDKVKPVNGRLPGTAYSQGQRKRLALMLAALEQRPVLLLDEWAADQDPEYRQLFYVGLLEYLRSTGKTVFAITHDERYFHLADRLLKMDAGQLVELQGLSRARASLDAVAALSSAD
ncbi:multidrug ABC transporter permease/ATP-binding protein [Pseudomonas akapageensis]|uniref:multidrug ABC transporter permease/ATP-binding protein n=1 Tax=Pseudomonas akapageensis TaxID=2609961 RepID=UPI00140AD380|nr:multidrug ABC transporter permease/ATP-binding protein [Pseudomonas akapageensis]